jgi:uncharacterized protein (TIGR02391 family)
MLTVGPEVARQLPVDELALAVLDDLKQTNEGNEYSYMLSYSQEWREAARPVAEALGWLRARGLIAREPDSNNSDAIFITRLGDWALTTDLVQVRSVLQVQQDLHPALQQRVRRQFLLGEYENAVFTAMRQIEIRVRALGDFSAALTGRPLMNAAFGSDGPLRDPAADGGEADSLMMFFGGAYGVLRNPAGHREVEYEDPSEVVEAVMTASLLMRILDRVETRHGSLSERANAP